jgi:hypothetical protein
MPMLEMRSCPGFVWRRTCGWDRDKSRHTDSYRVDENDDRVSSKELTNRMAALMRKAAA